MSKEETANTEEVKIDETTHEEVEANLDEKTVEELKAEAEKLETELKELKEKGSKPSEEELKQNQIRRIEKAQEKLSKFKKSDETPVEKIEVRDLITLGKLDISEDSEKAEILAKYKKGGLIKDYASGLEHAGVKAEFQALDERNTAKTVIDENADEETRLKTTKEMVAQYKASGEIPEDPKLKDALVRDNLKSMGL